MATTYKQLNPNDTAAFGTKGSQVTKLQNELNAKGANLKVDSLYGPLTQAAYNQYMSAQTTQPTVPTNTGSYLMSGLTGGEKSAEDKFIENYYANLQTQTNTKIDPEAIYQDKLKQSQGIIDAYNKIYADKLNSAKIEGKGRIEQRQFGQARSGEIASATGEAQVDRIENANRQVESSIQNELALMIAQTLGQVSKDATEEARLKTEAQKKGADELLNYYSTKKERTEAQSKSRLSNFMASLVGQGIDINSLSEQQLSDIVTNLGVNTEDIYATYNDLKTKKDVADLTRKETELGMTKTQKEIDQIGKLTPYQAASLALDREKKNEDSSKEIANLFQDKQTSGLFTSLPKEFKDTWLSHYGTWADPYSNDKTNLKDLQEDYNNWIKFTGFGSQGIADFPAEVKTPTAESLKQQIRQTITADEAFKKGTAQEKKDYILSLGGDPADFDL